MIVPNITLQPFKSEILEYILSLNRDFNQDLYKIYSLHLSTVRDDSDTHFSIWEFSIEDLDRRTTLELKTSLERILNADNAGEVKIILQENNFYDIQYIVY